MFGEIKTALAAARDFVNHDVIFMGMAAAKTPTFVRLFEGVLIAILTAAGTAITTVRVLEVKIEAIQSEQAESRRIARDCGSEIRELERRFFTHRLEELQRGIKQ